MHTCPRRVEMPRPVVENQDDYVAGRGVRDQHRGCSYCGSMSPEDFLAAIRAGKTLGVTDKNYKAYVGDYEGKFYFQHLSVEQQHEFIDLCNARQVTYDFPGGFTVLPFFMTTGPASA